MSPRMHKSWRDRCHRAYLGSLMNTERPCTHGVCTLSESAVPLLVLIYLESAETSLRSMYRYWERSLPPTGLFRTFCGSGSLTTQEQVYMGQCDLHVDSSASCVSRLCPCSHAYYWLMSWPSKECTWTSCLRLALCCIVTSHYKLASSLTKTENIGMCKDMVLFKSYFRF